MSTRTRARLRAGIAVAVALTAGCRVQVESAVDVDRGGGGSVAVTVTAGDDVRDALARGGLGDFGQALFGTSADRDLPAGTDGGDAFADLRRAGWQVDAVASGIRITRDFVPGEDLDAVLAGLGGGDAGLSPVQSLRVVHHGGFPSERIEASGRVGLTAAAITELATRAGSDSPTGAEMEDVLATSLPELVSVRFHIDQPGEGGAVEADPEPAAPDDLTWDLTGGRILDFAAESSYWNALVIWALAFGVIVVAAVVFVVWRVRR